MNDLSRFQRFLAKSAVQEANNTMCGEWEGDTILGNALTLFEIAAHVYEHAEGFEERLSWKEKITEDEINDYVRKEAEELIDGSSSILGLAATMKLITRLYGSGPVLHALLKLARERQLHSPPVTRIAYWCDEQDDDDDETVSSVG